MRLPKTNATFSVKRRTISSGNKKGDSTIQTGIIGMLQDTGTTADHEQTYLIMLNKDDVTATLNSDTDTISDGTSNYKCMNIAKKTYHYSIRAIKSL